MLNRVFLLLLLIFTPLNSFAEGNKLEIKNLRVKASSPYHPSRTEIKIRVEAENKSKEKLEEGWLCVELVDADEFQVIYAMTERFELLPGETKTVGFSSSLIGLATADYKTGTQFRVYWDNCKADPKNQKVSNVLIKKVEH